MKKKALCVLLSMALVFASADFTVFATEHITEIENVVEEEVQLTEESVIQEESIEQEITDTNEGIKNGESEKFSEQNDVEEFFIGETSESGLDDIEETEQTESATMVSENGNETESDEETASDAALESDKETEMTLIQTDVLSGFSLAQDINVNTAYTSALTSSSDEKWYKATVLSAGYISLSFKHDYVESTSDYWKAYIYDSNLEELASYSYKGSTMTEVQSGNIGISSGSYYIKVTYGGYYYSGVDYTVKLNYTASNAWETEFNETYAKANTIAVNTNVNGSIRKSSDIDWYKVEIPQNGYISLSFLHAYVNSTSDYWQAYIYDSNLEELANYSYQGSTMTVVQNGNIGVPAGSYYIKIIYGGYYYSSVDYTIKMNYTISNTWETEFNEKHSTADMIAVNTDINGSIRKSSDADWYKVEIPQKGYISLSFLHGYVNSTSDCWQAYIYDSNLEELAHYSYQGSTMTVIQNGNIGVPAGSYYVKIIYGGYYYSSVDYTIKMNYTISNAWETEFNETHASADIIAVNRDITGSIRESKDVDWYKVEIPQNGNILLSFVHDYVKSDSVIWKTYIYNSNLEELNNYSFKGSTVTVVQSENINVTAGTYYVKVTYGGYYYSDVNYTVRLQTDSYISQIYRVSFDLQGHGTNIDAVEIYDGDILTEPEEPKAEGYIFKGWYKEPECKNAWNFASDIVTKDITLYAKWLRDVTKDVIAEGKIDENYGNISWSIDKDGHLLVMGRGDYYSVGNDTPAAPPWLEYKDKIKTAKIALSGSKSVYAMFRDCTKLTEVDLTELSTDNVKYMHYMFDGCSSLATLDLSNLKTGNVSTMCAMFQGCSNLKALDLSNFDTGNLVDMEAMFLGCSNLRTLDVSSFKTDNVYSMGTAFAVCEKLTNLDLSSFDTGNVSRMCDMFWRCSNLTSLDLHNFRTDNVTDMRSMFEECKNLTTLDISNFDTSNVSKEDRCEDLLSGCVSLSYIHAPKNCTYSVELPVAAATDKWYIKENTECTQLPQNLGYSVKLYKNFYQGSSENSVVVKFDLQNHGTKIDDLIIKKGQKIQKPSDPVAEGYIFEGWYKEAECKTAWDFDKDVVIEDTTLYAGWKYSGSPSQGGMPDKDIPEGLWIAGIQEYTYTGKAIKPEVQVYFKNTKLNVGQDYTISFKNNIKAAGMNDKKAPTVTIKGKGNYSGTAVKTFTINKAMLTVSNLKAASSYQFGKAYTPVMILNGNVLKPKTDYTLTYKDVNGTVLKAQPTKELGSYIMHIEGKGNCGGSFDFKYKITQNGSTSIGNGKASVSEMLYGGKYPSTMLNVNGTILTSADYTVVFSNTNAKGTATATFIGIGKYTGVLKKNFKVVALPLQNNNITVAKTAPYEKGGARPEVTVKVNGAKLSEGIDYTVSYKGNAKLGNTAKVIVKGKGNYSGSASADFQIKGKALNEKDMKILVPDVVIGKKPVVTIYDANGKKLSSGSDYEAAIDQTKHTVTITGGKNGCYTGNVIKTYKEMPADKVITSVKLNKNAGGFPKDYNAYTGKEITLKNEWLTVKAKNTVLPSNGFTLSYMSNVEKGTATVIVQGKNGYSGIKTMTFQIKAYGLKNVLTWFVPKPDEPETETFTVKFSANGGSWGNKDEMTVTVKKGSTAALPAEPIWEGYAFTGWQDQDGNVFSEDTPVTKDITVYAQWRAETSSGSFAVTGGMSGIDYRYLDNTLTILTNKPLTIANQNPKISVSDTIIVADRVNADITLAGVNINVKETGSSASPGKAAFQIADDSVGNVTITLAKDTKNVLLSGYGRAGVEKDGDKNSGTLTIAGDGVLTAAGGYGAAGIGGKNRAMGGNCFHVTITGGEITADGGCLGAGIGSGGNEGNSDSITISGGNITANGGDNGAGIGGGNSENINILGNAVVFANGGKYGSGIGGSGAGSTYGEAALIKISGSAEVTAVGGDYSAGIGGSACSNANNIRIENNAKVKSTGGEKAAGIGGGGYNNPKGFQIEYGCNGSDIVICDFAEVTARGGKYGAGIGGGDYGNGKDIIIKGSANVSATGGDYGAGIGGGGSGSEYDENSNIIGGNGSNIMIDGGIVTAVGGKYGAGIGGGGNDWDLGGTGSDITISGSAKVTTSGGDYGAGIGGGSGDRGGGKGSNITINGNVIVFVEVGGIGHSGLDTGTTSDGSASFIRGVVFNGTAGVVYGSVALNVDAEVPENYMLTVPDGAALDVSQVIFTNNGKIIVETGGTVTGDILGDGILEKEDAPTNSYPDPFELPDLTGDRRADFIAVAVSQVGYMEGSDGSSYFGAWAGDPYCKWCSEFVAWCAEQANIPKTVIPKGTSSRKYRNFFADKGRYYYIAEGIDGKNTEFMSGYKNIGTVSAEDLAAGDIILKESDGDINNGPDHTAIFLEYEIGIVTYVSGNANDSVLVSHCRIEEFHGVCRPDF